VGASAMSKNEFPWSHPGALEKCLK